MKRIHFTEVTRIREAIKRLLKNRNLRYVDLADGLGLSLITIKRYMTKDDFSLSVLARMAQWFGMTFPDFMRYVTTDELRISRLTPEQDEFLGRHPGHCAYMIALRAGATPLQLERRHKLTRASTERYLLDLDRQGIIEYHSLSRIRLLIDQFIDLADAPCIRKAFYDHVLNLLPQHFKNKTAEAGDALIDIALLRLGDDSYGAMKRELDALFMKYSLTSRYEERTKKDESLTSVTLSILCDRWRDESFDTVVRNIG